jgi:hypothetical protein
MAINQISTANTFQQWLTATSALITTANTLTGSYGNTSVDTFIANTKLDISGTGSQLNVRNSGSINTLYSNTANITLANITTANVQTANVNILIGTANTAIYDRITAAEATSLAFSIALG